MNRSIPVCLALLCADVLAQESPGVRPYLRADFGMAKFLDVDASEDGAPPEFDALSEDLEKATEFSGAIGLMNSEGKFGLGLFYQRDASEGTLSGSFDLEGGTLTRTDLAIASNLVGLQGVASIPLGKYFGFRAEAGIGKVFATQTMKLDMIVPTNQGDVFASGESTIDFGGFAFAAGIGLDLWVSPKFAIGGMATMVRGSAAPTSGKETVTAYGQTNKIEVDLDDYEDSDISSIGLSLGIRIVL